MIRRIGKDLYEIRFYALLFIFTGLGHMHYALDDIQANFRIIPQDFFELDGFGQTTWLITSPWLLAEFVVLLLIAVNLFGGEFKHSAMGRLLAQPISRRRLFVEKVAVIFPVFALGLLVNGLLYVRYWEWASSVVSDLGPLYSPTLAHPVGLPPMLSYLRISEIRSIFIAIQFYTAFALFAVSAGVMASLFIRQPHTAFWAALILPAFMLTLFTLALSIFGPNSHLTFWVDHLLNARVLWWGFISYPLIPSLVCSAISFWIALSKFKRLEV